MQNMSEHLVSSSFLKTLLAYVRENGYKNTPLPARIEQLMQRYQWRMPKHEFLALLAAIKREYDKPALGFCIGRSLKPEHYGMVGHLAVACSSLGQALQRYQQHQVLVDSNLQTTIESTPKTRITRWWHNDSAAKGVWGEFGLMVFINFYQALIGRDIPPNFVELPGEPEGDLAIYEFLAGCPVIFGCKAVGISLPKMVYAKTISTNDSHLRSLYDRQAAALHQSYSDESEFLSSVITVLKNCISENQVDAKNAAKQLGVSLRTFYRRLDEEGFRFRTLLADLRFSLAKGYLKDEELSLAEVALLLSYSDQSAFTRAFVSWAGVTPSQYRSTLLK